MDSLQIDHTPILSEPVVQLPPSDIHGIYLDRTLLQQAIRKAAGRGADIEADGTLSIKGKMSQCSLELQATTRHVAKLFPHLDLCIAMDTRAGLIAFLPIHIHQSRHNQPLGLCTAFGQPPLGQQVIKTLFFQPERAGQIVLADGYRSVDPAPAFERPA